MNNFKKYTKITNHYNVPMGRLMGIPNYHKTSWIITEKLDGANFSVIITKDNIQFASRNRVLDENESFFNWQEVMGRYREQLMTFTYWMLNNGYESMHIYGELFGAGVQKRIHYRDDQDFRIFDMRLNGEYIPVGETIKILMDTDTTDMFVPIVTYKNTLQEALEVSPEGLKVEGVGREVEGFVIAPYDELLYLDLYTPVRIKHKTKAFCDKMNVKAKVRKKFEGSHEYQVLKPIWDSMINENRVLDLYSKHGKIQDPSEIGKYIKLMIEDVKEDFFEDNMELFKGLDKAEQKKLIGSTGSLVAPLIKQSMKD